MNSNVLTDQANMKKTRFRGAKTGGRMESGRAERVLAQAADGAYPILGNVFPLGAGSDAAFGIAHFGIIDVTAGALVLFHDISSLRG